MDLIIILAIMFGFCWVCFKLFKLIFKGIFHMSKGALHSVQRIYNNQQEAVLNSAIQKVQQHKEDMDALKEIQKRKEQVLDQIAANKVSTNLLRSVTQCPYCLAPVSITDGLIPTCKCEYCGMDVVVTESVALRALRQKYDNIVKEEKERKDKILTRQQKAAAEKRRKRIITLSVIGFFLLLIFIIKIIA